MVATAHAGAIWLNNASFSHQHKRRPFRTRPHMRRYYRLMTRAHDGTHDSAASTSGSSNGAGSKATTVTTTPPSPMLQPFSVVNAKGPKASKSRFQIMGLDPSPELLAIAMVYFVQGILGLSRLALSFFFKDTLHVEPAEVAILTGLSSFPWMVKPLYGFISDSVPLLGYRRRSYLILCGVLGATSWATLAFWVDSVPGAVAAMVVASLGTAFSDVVVDSLVVERARGEPQATSGSLQSLCWASAAVGGIASAYFSGSLVEDYGTRFVFGITALFPLVVSASALLIDEKPVYRKDQGTKYEAIGCFLYTQEAFLAVVQIKLQPQSFP